MKEVLSVFTFGIGALCFVVFVTMAAAWPACCTGAVATHQSQSASAYQCH